jgi:hypothetical protein
MNGLDCEMEHLPIKREAIGMCGVSYFEIVIADHYDVEPSDCGESVTGCYGFDTRSSRSEERRDKMKLLF